MHGNVIHLNASAHRAHQAYRTCTQSASDAGWRPRHSHANCCTRGGRLFGAGERERSVLERIVSTRVQPQDTCPAKYDALEQSTSKPSGTSILTTLRGSPGPSRSSIHPFSAIAPIAPTFHTCISPGTGGRGVLH
jgi:hypothetical protein